MISAVVTAFVLSSCNTFIGMGRDFQQLGSGLENSGNLRSWNNSTDSSGGGGVDEYGVPQ